MKNRILVGFIAATAIPPLGAMLTVTTMTIGDVTFWLHIATILVASLAASGIYALTMWNKEVGADFPTPGSITTTVVKIPPTPVPAPTGPVQSGFTAQNEQVIGQNP